MQFQTKARMRSDPVPRVRRPASRFAKRGIDIVGACVGLIVSTPVVAVSGVAIWRKMGMPVFYSQERPGLDEHIIRVHKLRTMTDAIRPDGTVVPEFDRVTPLGRWLRKMSIDELPQFWNVLKGDMSLVGPRPLLCEYLEFYDPVQRRRHDVRPGMTGWSQVQRQAIEGWDRQLELDVWYVDHQSVALDVKIIVMTIAELPRLARGDRANHSMTTLSRSVDGEMKFRGSAPADPRRDADGEKVGG
jgi:sugar transferase EpsL